MRETRTRSFLFLVLFSLSGSLFTRLSGLNPGPIAPVTSLLTIVCGVVAAFSSYARQVPRAWARVVAALTVGAGSELLGLATGYPFGRYAYTAVWWPTVDLPIGRFPVMLPVAWLLMAGASTFVAARLSGSGLWRTVLLGGLVAATVDLLMEPVMAGPLGYWRWTERGPLPGGAPFTNFLGWWATASLAGAILLWGVPAEALKSRQPAWVLALFVVLVLGLGLIIGL